MQANAWPGLPASLPDPGTVTGTATSVSVRTPRVHVHSATQLDVSTATVTLLSFEVTDYDEDTSTPQHDNNTNNDRLVCQDAGLYLITTQWSVVTQGNSGGVQCFVNLTHIGGGVDRVIEDGFASGPDAAVSKSSSTLWPLNVGDYIQAYLYQSTGITIPVNVQPPYEPALAMVKVG